MNFTDFIGNEKVINRIDSLFSSGKFPHAVLIEGDEGLGKKTLARLIACALVCRSDGDKPCGECSQCSKARQNIHPDISEYIPSGSANSFHIDTVREIINDIYIKPNEAEYKIYILANAHCMNRNAQNALLKILEEPPEYAVFILTATSKSALLPTVLSRCTSFTLEGVDSKQGAKRITEISSQTNYDDALKTIEIFGGNIGKAIAGIENEKTSALADVCKKICKSVAEADEYGIVTLCSAFEKDRQGVIFACEFLKNIFRDALCAADDSDYISGQREIAAQLKSRLGRKKLVALIVACDEIKSAALMNANNTLLITELCCKLKCALS